jgi:protein-S-isoprenylcysteine O-methyltransferase Ste14
MKIKLLLGSADKIWLFTMPFLIIGLAANIWKPEWFRVGGPPSWLIILSIVLLVPGVVSWAWSVFLILAKVPKKVLITSGPYAVVKHPLYTGVSLLVLPWVGFLLNTWLGALVGVALYTGSRLYAPEEERMLGKAFGAAWDVYSKRVKIPWL